MEQPVEASLSISAFHPWKNRYKDLSDCCQVRIPPTFCLVLLKKSQTFPCLRYRGNKATKSNLRFPRFSLFGLRMSKMMAASLRIRPSLGQILKELSCVKSRERQPHQSPCVFFYCRLLTAALRDMNKFKSGRRSSEPYNRRTRGRLANCESSGNNVKFGKFSSL